MKYAKRFVVTLLSAVMLTAAKLRSLPLPTTPMPRIGGLMTAMSVSTS